MRSWLVGIVAAVLLTVGTSVHADLVNHVRVILDTSGSMKGGYNDPDTGQFVQPNDPGRLAVLSTVLLLDLVKPQLGKGKYLSGSFAVLPFDHNLNWTGISNPPTVPVKFLRLLGSEPQDRTQFITKLSESSMPRNAQHTFYAPYIAKALQDLPTPHPQDSEATTRTIVLITDGVSENEPGDKAYIADTLLEEMHKKKTRLYVIFFSPDPARLSQGKAFFNDIRQADQANIDQGKYKEPVFPEGAFPVQRGDELPGAMVRLFSRAYGYVHDEQDDQWTNVGANAIHPDLAKTYNPEEAVVVALRLSASGLPPNPPVQDLHGPGGAYVNKAPPRTASELGGSFSAVWVESPVSQNHSLGITDGIADYVFVLRPTRLKIALREYLSPPAAPQNRSCFDPMSVAQALSQGQERFETMANTECWIDFLVSSAAGNAQGLPQNLKLTFWVKERLGTSKFRFIGSEDGTAIPGPNKRPITTPQQEGQRFYYWTNFKEDKRPPGSAPRKFKAEVTVHVDLGDATVAYRGDDNPFRVDVYPLVAVEPDPREQPIPPTTSALQREESGETVFNLKEIGNGIVEGVHVNKADPFGDHDYMVQAYLTGRDANGNPQPGPPPELKGATFELDGRSICFEQGGAASGCDWDQAVALKREQLVCRGIECTLTQPFVHRLAVRIGKHDNGDPLNPAVIDVHFRLRHPPYDHFRVIRSFGAKIYVAKQNFDPWALLPFLLLLLGLLAALMLLRPRFALPKDLGYGLATMANPHRFQARRLPSASPWKLLFSRKAERVATDRDGELLGWVRPEDDELYGLRPAPGVEVVDARGKVLEPESGVTLLQVHQAYRLRRSSGDLMFRMAYL
jgi:hypothetical protein